MKRFAAYYLLTSCVFLLGYAAFVLAIQWSDADGSDLVLVLVLWILPCVSGIYVVFSNGLYRRPPARSSPE